MLRHLNDAPTPPSRVVVLGAGGFVGGALVKRLAHAGTPTVALTRSDIDLMAPGASDALAHRLRPDDAVVAAAAAAPCKSTRMLADNLVMTLTMIEALQKSPVAHVVNISSDAVYADTPVPITEDTPTAPNSLHGAMHLARELAFQNEVKAPLAILRPSLLYGAADPHNGYGPNRFRRLANEAEPIILFGAGEERRDLVLIDDVAEVIVRVVERRSAGTLNIATGEVHSFAAIAELVVAAAGRKIAIETTPRGGPMPHNGYRPFDIAACRAAFPDFTYTAIKEGLAKAQRDMKADQ
jgi:nucleoside-diphosphate-sugar epimerase